MNSVISYFVIGLFFLAITGTLCQSSDPRIVGGVEAKPNEIPYQVSLRFTSNNQHFCGGTLITDRHVLTAAHCTIITLPLKPSEIYVQVGSTFLTAGITRKVVTIQTHSAYSDKGVTDDIALLRLETPFIFTDAIRNITLRASAVKDNENCTVSGFGTLRENGGVSSKLMVVAIPIVNHTLCKTLYTLVVPIESKMICAGFIQGGKDSCQGDSGGPLVCGGALTGIVSFGVGCARPGYPGVNTEVFKYKDWIANAINGAIGTSTLSTCLFVLVQLIVIFLH